MNNGSSQSLGETGFPASNVGSCVSTGAIGPPDQVGRVGAVGFPGLNCPFGVCKSVCHWSTRGWEFRCDSMRKAIKFPRQEHAEIDANAKSVRFAVQGQFVRRPLANLKHLNNFSRWNTSTNLSTDSFQVPQEINEQEFLFFIDLIEKLPDLTLDKELVIEFAPYVQCQADLEQRVGDIIINRQYFDHNLASKFVTLWDVLAQPPTEMLFHLFHVDIRWFVLFGEVYCDRKDDVLLNLRTDVLKIAVHKEFKGNFSPFGDPQTWMMSDKERNNTYY